MGKTKNSPVIRTLRIYSLSNFHVYHIAMVTTVIMLYITSLYFFPNKLRLVFGEVLKTHVLVTEHITKLSLLFLIILCGSSSVTITEKWLRHGPCWYTV